MARYLTIVFGLIGFVFILLLTPARETGDLYAYDLGSKLLAWARGQDWTKNLVRAAPHTDQLVVVVIDDESVRTFSERLPMARSRLANFVRTATRAGASVVALDYFLHGRSVDDEGLRQALTASGRVVLGMREVPQGSGWRPLENDPAFSHAALEETDMYSAPDSDGLIRSFRLFFQSDGVTRRGLPLAAVAHHWKLKSSDVICPAPGDRQGILEGGVGKLDVAHSPEGSSVGHLRIPLYPDPDVVAGHSMLLDIASTSLPFQVISFKRLDEELAHQPDLVKGKIVLLGDAIETSNIWHSVPVAGNRQAHVSSVELVAYAICAILKGNAPQRASPLIDMCLLFAVALAGGLIFTRLSLGPSFASLLGITMVVVLGNAVVFLTSGIWIGTSLPLMMLVTLFAGSFLKRFIEEQEAHKNCKALISSYFSAAAAIGLGSADEPPLAAIKENLEPEHYQIVSKLGQGGMSVVYSAVQQPMGRIVALKYISPQLHHNALARKRFLQEARLAGSLHHPNLVTVWDCGEVHGVPYIAMEYVDGEDLKSLISRKKRLEPPQALAILKEALRGLAHVHEHGIIHRDIKAENILISRDGLVKLADFGIAKAKGGNAVKTLPEMVLGTPAYMSPELIRGEPLSPSSDIYSMGIVLYEMLTGNPPFLGDSVSRILLKHVHDQPPRVEDFGVELQPGLWGILQRTLEKRPEDRFDSALEFLAAVEKIAPTESQPVRAVPSGPEGVRYPTLATEAVRAGTEKIPKTPTGASIVA